MTPTHLWRRVATLAGRGFALLLTLALTAWAAAALYFDLLPGTSLRTLGASSYGLAMVGALLTFRGRGKAIAICLAGFALVLAWWLTLKPSNDRAWQPDVAQTAWAEIDGDHVTIHNVRNCDYRTEGDYTPHWETRSYDLSQIRGMDIFLTYWGSPWIAHPIVSFQFGDNDYIAMSIETRKEVGEQYSAIRGFFRYYELIYTVSDERDVVRLRTNYRKGEETYLFHTRATPEHARATLLNYLKKINRIRNRPEWYNALTNNCTTNIATLAGEPQLDWRVLLNGRADQMLFERGDLATGNLPFAQLKQQAHINAAARAANDAPDFSRRIREGRAGF
ncbi:MAG TPA: DUF4105 domain-containing protein [Terriglobales bacterium]|nr:DUF4105 domain-containing protein [Terriglobales bacterium]